MSVSPVNRPVLMMSSEDDERKQKSLDVNKYATKKTIAQGLLDVALLTANASQLKYVLQVGNQHEFYTLMLTLISISIILQIAIGCVCVLLGSQYNINRDSHCPRADQYNNALLCLNVVLVVINILINSFDMNRSNPSPIGDVISQLGNSLINNNNGTMPIRGIGGL